MLNVRNMLWLMTTPVITALVCWLIWTLIV